MSLPPSTPAVNSPAVSTATKKTKRHETFSTYNYRLIRTINGNIGIAQTAMNVLNEITNDLFVRLATESANLARINKRTTLGSAEIRTSTALLIPGELGANAISSAAVVVEAYLAAVAPDTTGATKNGPVNRSSRAGLTLPVGRIERYLRKQGFAKRVSKSCPVFLTAVLEYVVMDLISNAIKVAVAAKKQRITPRHIMQTIFDDMEFSALIGSDAKIMRGGVPVNVHPNLEKRKVKKITKRKSRAAPKATTAAAPVAKPATAPVTKTKVAGKRQRKEVDVTAAPATKKVAKAPKAVKATKTVTPAAPAAQKKRKTAAPAATTVPVVKAAKAPRAKKAAPAATTPAVTAPIVA